MCEEKAKTRSTVLGVIALALGYTFYSNFFNDQETQVQVGDEAPNFVLEDLEGKRVELEEYKGQGVFLNFWGTFCPPCEREMPYMENQYQIYQEQDVEILAVNVGETDLAVSRFVDRHELTFPIPMDKGSDVVDRYGVRPLPTTFLIDSEGIVTKVITGGMTEEHISDYMESITP
ncbi:thiol-disulfide oxidoreductase ResA [Thalassorhabdus alkalitolerans]|uniref:Thiol-disulfide oxidoreductase ResA n=1 Tax=Thalassorhabdus alkalitolerans TaxID=2282697 RepID=A0ABW0YKJ7_9BACI